MRILIVRLSALGDVLMTLPLAKALRRRLPGAEIHFATQTEFAALLDGHPDLDGVVPIPVRDIKAGLFNPLRWPKKFHALRGLRRRLKGRKYDVVLDAHGNLKSGLVAALTGAPQRIGPSASEAKEGNSLFMTGRPVAPPSTRRHRRDRALSLLSALGIPPEDHGCRLPEYPQDFSRKHLPPSEGPLVLLHPGTSPKAAFKRWPTTLFGGLSQSLTEKGATCLVVGGPGEETLVREVVESSQGTALPLPVPPGLPALGGLLQSIDLYVGADSGPAQLAHAAGTKTVVLFGPKDPELYGPRSRGVSVVRKLACRPCGKRRCPLARVECLEDLRVETVVEACLLMLEGGRTSEHFVSGKIRLVRQE